MKKIRNILTLVICIIMLAVVTLGLMSEGQAVMMDEDESIDETEEAILQTSKESMFRAQEKMKMVRDRMNAMLKTMMAEKEAQKEMQEEVQEESYVVDYSMTKNQYTTDTCNLGYWLYVPELSNKNEQLPLIVSLHSGNGTGRDLDNLAIYDEGFPSYILDGKTTPKAVVLMPQSPSGWWWKFSTEAENKGCDELMELIEHVVEEYGIDRSRIYITGVSRGGVATYRMLIRFPDYFAAAMPVASAVNPYGPAQYIKTPMRIYHGQWDLLDTGGTTTMGNSVEILTPLINENGGNCELIILPGIGHGGQFIYWDTENYDAMDWLLSQVNEHVIIENRYVKNISNYFNQSYQDENTYSSENVYVKVDKYEKGEGNQKITYYVADIHIKDISSFRRYLANDTFGSNNLQTVLNMDLDSNAVIAMTGDYYGYRGESIEMVNGNLLRNVDNPMDICVLYKDGRMITYTADEFNADQAVADGAYQIWSFGPMLLDNNGNIPEHYNDHRGIGVDNPRSAIGYYEPGHYCFVVVDGRNYGYSKGMTFEELSELFIELGCVGAYNLDGGGSTTLTFNDQVIDVPSNGDRLQSDVVIIKDIG